VWQSPQTMKTPDHSAVARLKHELQDERKKLQVLPYLLQPPARAASFLPFSKTAAHDTTAWQALTRSNQQSVDKMAEYKERYRGLRAAMGDKDKQLDLAKRTIERLSGQCNAMEASNPTHFTCFPH